MGFYHRPCYTAKRVRLYSLCLGLMGSALYVLYGLHDSNMSVLTSNNSTVVFLQTVAVHQAIEREENSSLDFMNSQLIVQEIRHKYLREACGRHPELSTRSLSHANLQHIRVMEKERIVYCFIPKVASSNWLRVLSVVSGYHATTDNVSVVEIHKKHGMKPLSSYSQHDRMNILQNYTTFIFAREPIRRIISAYLNRFRDMSVFNLIKGMQMFGKRILKNYRPDATSEQLRTGENVTLREFATFLTNPKERKNTNQHWDKMYQICSPCLIHYDYLGHLETLADDARYLLTSLGLNDKISFPDKGNSEPTNSSGVYNSVLDEVPKELLKSLYRVYELDYELFGYPKPNFVL